MLRNTDQKALARLAVRYTAGRRIRSLIMGLSVLLSWALLFTAFTVGKTWLSMEEAEQLRLRGADYDAYLYGGFSQEQREICQEFSQTGLLGTEGYAGAGMETERDGTLHVGLLWADKTQWEEIKGPAMKKLTGKYPEKANEVMATQAALADCGYGARSIGDSFCLTYEDKKGVHTEEFVISGMWEGYGAQQVFYVSEEFYERSGYTLKDEGRGFLYLKFQRGFLFPKEQEELEKALGLTGAAPGSQEGLFYSMDFWELAGICTGIFGLALLTCFSAYLLIYSIMNLSAAENVRYYGLLQTIGMSGRQVGRFLIIQTAFVCGTGMLLGMILGSGGSFLLVPGIVGALGTGGEKVQVIFSPGIFLFSTLLVGVTVVLAGREPVKKALEVTPIEALGHRGLSGRGLREISAGRGGIVWRLAFRQLTKNKKRTATTILSLSAAFTVLLCVLTILEGRKPEKTAMQTTEFDMLLKNDTMDSQEEREWKPLMDRNFEEAVEENPLFGEVRTEASQRMVLPWEADFADLWIRKFYDRWEEESYEDIIEDYRAHPENYGGYVTGITREEFLRISEGLEDPMSEEEFLTGRTCILCRGYLKLESEEVKGKQVKCLAAKRTGEEADIPMEFCIGGMTEDSFYAGLSGKAPTLLVSREFLEQEGISLSVSKMAVNYREPYDKTAENKILALVRESPYSRDFSWESRIEERERLQAAQGNTAAVGAGIAAMLACIGFLNYSNTVSGSVQSRRNDLAVLESVGMSPGQVQKMLVLEGLFYGVLSLLLAAGAGTLLAYGLYALTERMGVPFSVPLLPAGLAAAAGLFLLGVLPLVFYRLTAGKGSMAERLREPV